MSVESLIRKSSSFELSDKYLESKEKGRLEFISKFPLENISKMTLDEYVLGTNKDSFCYWLEFKKIEENIILFGIGGGNSSKFGLYKSKSGEYQIGYGDNKKELKGSDLENYFNSIKNSICLALSYVNDNRIEEIKQLNVPFGNMILQKILAIYFPDKFITIGSSKILIELAKEINLENIELSANNLIEINYECKKIIDNLPEFKNWEYEKIGTLIWEYFDGENKKKNTSKRYFLLGSYWDDIQPNDQTSRFIQNGIWENGYEDKFIEEVKAIPVGSTVAIKAAFTREKTKSVMAIKAIGIVLENKNDGKTLKVNWNDKFIPFEVNFSGGYWSTINEVNNKDHINSIFYGNIIETNLFESVKIKFKTPIFKKYILLLRKVLSELKIHKSDERVVYSIRENRLNFTVGQRYGFNLYLSDSRGVYGAISKTKLKDNSEPFEGNLPQPYYNFFNDFNPNSSEWESILEAIKDELSRTSKSGYRRYNNEDFENYVFDLNTEIANDKIEMKLPLNTILYGPPGTGKTHILKNQYMDMFTSSENSITREDFLKDIIQNCSWWQVIALAVLELGKTKVTDIFNHEYVQIKAQLSNSTTVTPTIWGQLQSHTIEQCENVKVAKRMSPLIFNKTEKSEWEILQNEIEEQSPELLELKLKIENFESVPNKRIERFEFLTFHQSYSYEDFIEGIKPELSESDVSYKIEEGVFQKMCNRARNDSSNNYAIFIDEINRGNISSIFGELITLIEDDKREGKSNEIKATLPYSKKHFSVPNNLYIIGTMNTADRSVEALDTALRRRFSFIEMNPEPEKLNSNEFKCNGIDLEALLNAINGRIEKLLDKDYCIGHSYFMTINNREEPLEEIKAIFQNKILPLLQEYFYGDWGKILLVIGKEFVVTKKNTIKFLSTDSYEEFEEYDEKPIYNFTKSSNWTLDSFKSIYE